MAISLLPTSVQDADPLLLSPPTASSSQSLPSASSTQSAHMTTTTLKVEGMTCGACTSAVEGGLKDVEGVGNVSVSLVMERAVVTHDAEKISAAQIREIIEDRGFDAEVLSSDLPQPAVEEELMSETESDEGMEAPPSGALTTTTVSIGGMTCGACTSAVEGAFKDVPGIKSFSISLLAERAVIEHDPTLISAEKIAETIEDTGFDASVLDSKVVSVPASPKISRRRRSAFVVKQLYSTTVAIEGMTCGACTSAVEILHDPSKLSTAQIVEIVEDRGFDATILSSQEEGLQTTSGSAVVQLKIYGLKDSGSAESLSSLLQDQEGIMQANVNFSTCRANVTYNSSRIGLRAIVQAVEKAGYNALVAENEDNNAQLESLAKTKEIQEWSRAFRTSVTFAVPVFLTSMLIPMFLPFLDFGSIKLPVIPGLWLGDVVCLLLTIPVQFGIGKRFYVSAFRSIRHGSPTMDVLVVLEPHSRPATTFDTSTMLITFILLGRFLENRAKGQTSRALSRLMSLAPFTAVIYADPIAAMKAAEGWNSRGEMQEKALDEKEEVSGVAMEERTVPTELLEVGDIVILKPGDKIPADGTVTRGESYVDESMVTGEAMPILKKKDSLLMAGTVNGAGRVDFKVTRAGRDTQLSQIVRLVQEAQTSRASIQRVADIVAGYFVPIIITLGLATFTAWMVLSHILPHPPHVFTDHASGGKLMVCVKLCIAVIVFACPCALGLATPTAVMVGTGVGAEQGILIKGGAALETATKISHVVLDKTGTLTMGKMSVAKADIKGDWASDPSKLRMWWTLIGLAETSSEHPIGKAIVNAAKSHLNMPVDGQLDGNVGDFEAVVGKGISTYIEAGSSSERQRYHVLVGNASFLRSKDIEVPASEDEEYDAYSTPTAPKIGAASSSKTANAGTTTIHTAISGAYMGSLSLSDTLKPSAASVVAALHKMGIATSIVTGDQPATAHHVAALLNIPPSNVHAGVLPSGKQEIIERLQRAGEIVAMVGDGINDSPALAAADVGISLASGTDVAVEAADVVLMKPNQLMDIPASLHLSRTIFRRIKMNLIWACVYNAVGLPVAMGFLLPWGISLPPMAAGAAMACSSVTVVVSSLLLKWWRRPGWMAGGEEEDKALTKVAEEGWMKRLRGLLRREKRKDREGERGAYVPLESYEAV
ncbi:Cu(2+)-transporting P-type ATPase [Taxawa tesnikishii (nom. ined.)]|nr:Cu(2+)-transporting P-type ATPase [Dothideales sp. JES 119]